MPHRDSSTSILRWGHRFQEPYRHTHPWLYIYGDIYIHFLNTKISRTQSKKNLETQILEYRIHILNIYQRVLLERSARKLETQFRDWCSQPLCDSISRNRVAICRSCYRSSGEASGERFHHLSPRGPLELLFSYVQLHRNGPKIVVEADVELLAVDRLIDRSKVIMFKDLRGAMVTYRDRRDALSLLYVGRWS